MKHSSGFRRASVLVYSFILLGAATLLLLKDGVKGVLTVAPGGDRSHATATSVTPAEAITLLPQWERRLSSLSPFS